MRRTVFRIAVLALPFAIACTAASVGQPTQDQGPTNGSPTTSGGPGPSGGPAPPNLDVTVALASVRLGDENCTHDESMDLVPQSCAALTDASPRGTGLCGGPCKFTNMQLAFSSTKSGSPSKVEIVGVNL